MKKEVVIKKAEPVPPGIVGLVTVARITDRVQSCDSDSNCDGNGSDPGCDSGCECDSAGDSGECYGGYKK